MPWAASDPLRRPAAQDVLEYRRDQRADERADEIDPVAVEVPADEHRGERSARVHRCPRHRRPHTDTRPM